MKQAILHALQALEQLKKLYFSGVNLHEVPYSAAAHLS